MQYRTFGRTGWKVSEIGYGMWGMAGWTGSDDEESRQSLDRAVALGCTFFDTAWAYGSGRSEQLLGEMLKRHPDKRLYSATKIPPKNGKWPARPEYRISDVFPADHIRQYTETSLRNMQTGSVDLQQFHVWDDSWATDLAWQRAVGSLKDDGLVKAIGISINRWQPTNVLKTLGTDLIDSVQVVYNVFDQAPEDELFVECQRRNIAIVARVPFDEGSLTGTLTAGAKWPEGDFRNIYFQPDNLKKTLERVDRLRAVVPPGMTMPELALRHILQHPAVSSVIPGMRKARHVEQNLAASDGRPLPAALMQALRGHRWDRWIDIP
jgi:aryl-alcohol dehydrogenase-like predicted oxidoreductase